MILDTRKSFEPAPDTTALDYDLNVLDLESTSQHVEMPSNLTDRAVFSERRTDVAEALKLAFERDPTRRDLLMKLLEVYHLEAAVNQRAFLDMARKVSRQRDFRSSEDWKKIVTMGREIAASDPLFSADDDDQLPAKYA
jgi:hypothetical protein